MADEDVTIPDSSVASQNAPTVGRLRRSTSENELLRNAPQLDHGHFLFILDDKGNKYPIPWKSDLDYTRFKSYVEEIYTRNGGEDYLDQVRNGGFYATYDTVGGSCAILPSLWSDLVREGMTVRISFGPRSITEQGYLRSEDKGVDIIEVESDVDAGHDIRERNRKDKDSYFTSSSEEGISVKSDDDISELSESEPDRDDEAKEVPYVDPIRVVVEPVNNEGAPLSFRVDTRWAAKHFAADKDKNDSKDSLTKVPQNGRDMISETVRITRASTTTAENRATLEVYTLPGPEKDDLSSSISTKWFHLHGATLDWAQFKDMCLAIPDLSERGKFLVAKTLHKIEKEYIKTFLGGMFIEPGTVLRSDECNQPEPSSVIFSCTPYFDIRKAYPPNVQADRLHPARTLIQSLYPYEPVRDRDREQAYKKFYKAKPNELIHVPSLWMLNVDDRAVVTCGYDTLSTFFTKSLKLLPEELKQRGTSNSGTKNFIRFRDLDGRVLLYSLEECSTYFQIEQRTRELRRFSTGFRYLTSPHIIVRQQGGRIQATPSNWPAILRQTTAIFIDLSLVRSVPAETQSTGVQTSGSVPPFYLWPSPPSKGEAGLGTVSADVTQSTKCLEQVENAMLNEILPKSDTGGPVDATFTSTDYYEFLPPKVFADAREPLLVQVRKHDFKGDQSRQTHHQAIVRAQSSKLSTQAHKFVEIVNETLALFVESTDKYAVLQKLWGALTNVAMIVGRLGSLSCCNNDPEEYTNPKWKTPKTGTRSWRIRTPKISYTYANQHGTDFKLPLPAGDDEFGATVKRCKRCARETPFDDPNIALNHLRKHASIEASKQENSASSSFVKDVEEWKDWIRNDDQALLESTLAGACGILERATQEAQIIYEQLRALADGVRDDQGNLSELYRFPRKLIETLHRLLIFYFAVERSMYHTEKCFDESKKGGYLEDYPYTDMGLQVLEKFSGSVKSLVKQARDELCEMVRTYPLKDPTERMLWGAESISSWLIRRLIVKPLLDGATVGDMYRDYLQTLQFQVNHHPGKRLLRSINLIQEELTILARVNEWQVQLVENYTRILDDDSYPTDIPSRRALFPHERRVLDSCLDHLDLTRQEYQDLIRRCGPLSESTKQSAEINEEDHGKAILVFTVVTVIFLPLSFVTSYLGMNTSDIRDMDSKQSLFWEIALPLTVGVMAIMLAIAYNGDEIRDLFSSVYRSLTGKQDHSRSARGISVLQRNRAPKNPTDSATTLSVADEAEYAVPRIRPDHYHRDAWDDDWYQDRNARYYTDPKTTVQNRHARPQERRPAFPMQRSEAVPIFSEPMRFSAPTYRVQVPVSTNRYARRRRSPSVHSEVMPMNLSPPRPPGNRPAYTKINRKYVTEGALEDLSQPWEDDPADPDIVIVKGQLTERDTDRLFAESKRTKRGRRSSWDDEQDGYGTGGPRNSGKDEYVWENKKEKERRAKQRWRSGPRYRY